MEGKSGGRNQDESGTKIPVFQKPLDGDIIRKADVHVRRLFLAGCWFVVMTAGMFMFSGEYPSSDHQ